MYYHAFILLLAIAITGCGGDNGKSSPEGSVNVHKCDEYAAHPDDPQKWAVGVSEDDLAPGPAIKYCTEAVLQSPDTPRFQFQLGRALLKAQRFDEAIEALVEAAEDDYGPSYAYLGDVYRSGILGKEDYETAAAYYDLAIASGFSPAEEAKAGLYEQEDTDTVDVYQEEAATESADYYSAPPKPRAGAKHFDPARFSKGNVLLAIHDGNFGALDSGNQFLLNVYLVGINDYFSASYNMMDESCSAYADPGMSSAITRRVLSSAGLGMELSAEQRSMNTLKMLAEGIQDFQQTGGSGLMQGGMNIEDTKRAATRDGVLLAKNYGCESQVFQRFYGNFITFVRGQEPKFLSGMAGLKAKCRSYSKAKGSTIQDADKICSCFTDKFTRKNVSLTDVDWLSANYDQSKNFNRIVKKYDGLGKEIAGCLLQN